MQDYQLLLNEVSTCQSAYTKCLVLFGSNMQSYGSEKIILVLGLSLKQFSGF